MAASGRKNRRKGGCIKNMKHTTENTYNPFDSMLFWLWLASADFTFGIKYIRPSMECSINDDDTET